MRLLSGTTTLMCGKCLAQDLVIHGIVLGFGRGWKGELKIEPTIKELKESQFREDTFTEIIHSIEYKHSAEKKNR